MVSGLIEVMHVTLNVVRQYFTEILQKSYDFLPILCNQVLLQFTDILYIPY